MIVLKDICRKLIESSGDKKAGFYFRQRVGLAIQRGNALAVMGTMERGDLLLE